MLAVSFSHLQTQPSAFAQGLPVLFADVSALLNFEHRSTAFNGSGLAGAAWFDFNNDGLLDLFLTNGKEQPNGLFQNNGDGSFTDVAAQAGVQNGLGNSGVVAADVDNDGFKDLFLVGFFLTIGLSGPLSLDAVMAALLLLVLLVPFKTALNPIN